MLNNFKKYKKNGLNFGFKNLKRKLEEPLI